jgi:hypothetical protein
VIEDRGLRCADAARVVVDGDGVQDLREDAVVEAASPFLDEPQAEVDVAEQLAFVGREKERPAVELANAPGVVQQRGCEKDVRSEPRMQLRRVAAERRDCHGVLDEAAGIGVVRLGSRGQRAQTGAEVGVADERPDETAEAGMRDLAGEKLEEAVELLDVSARLRGERRRICLGRLESPHLELESIPEALDAPEHPDRVTLAEAFVQEVDVAPHSGVDAAARIDELEREVRASAPRAKALLARDCENAFDDPVLGELRDRHPSIVGPRSAASLAAVPLVKPFRALRYSETAGSLDELVSPPYDVISPAVHKRLLASSPYNSVRLVRPDDAAEAARMLKDWQDERVLVREGEPAVWLLEEEFEGPDGVQRTRRSLVARAALQPYEGRIVLPHERSFPKPREGRLELLRATHTKLSPILLLHEGPPPPPAPSRPADLEATLDGVRSRLWRLAPGAAASIEPPLVIADGHHRYEAALRFHEEEGSIETGHVLAALTSSQDPGLTIFPTHRLAGSAPPSPNGTKPVDEAFAELESLPRTQAGYVVVRPGGAELVVTGGPGLDTALVDDLGLEDVRYTASAEDAIAEVESGRAAAAFLVRAPSVEEVTAAARAGLRMPEKSTYFYPKLAAGLLFAPFDE